MTTALTRTQRAQTTTRSTQSSGGGSVVRGTLWVVRGRLRRV